MTRELTLAISMILFTAASSAAVPQQPKAPGIESENYVWNEPSGEKMQLLKLKGNVARGKEAYRVCQGCHRPDGSGRPDGSYPQLAGQHANVLIKQMADIREGRRSNPKMYPFAGQHAIGLQDIADIAAFLRTLPVPPNNGKGLGEAQEKAKAMYQKDCQICHGENGEGNGKKFYPLLVGQHYKYMQRQMIEIRDGKRRNANPRMVKAVRNYSDEEISAIADFLSRLPVGIKGIKR